jgi:hypothetical protein
VSYRIPARFWPGSTKQLARRARACISFFFLKLHFFVRCIISWNTVSPSRFHVPFSQTVFLVCSWDDAFALQIDRVIPKRETNRLTDTQDSATR